MSCLILYPCQWCNDEIDNHDGSRLDDHYYYWYRHFISYYETQKILHRPQQLQIPIGKIIDLDRPSKHVHDSLSMLGAGTTIKGGEVKLIYVPKSDLPMKLCE